MMTHVKKWAFFMALASFSAEAADWSDTYAGYRYGTQFAEPFINKKIAKNIFSLTHASGNETGSHYFNADMLLSDGSDPSAPGSTKGAREAYVVYRYTLDMGRATDREYRFGPVRNLGLTAGFDFNIKKDAGYNSRKRMLVAGPTLMMDVPGFLNASFLALWESNAPYSGFNNVSTPRYAYRTHPMLNLAWGIPLGIGSLSFEGYADFIAPKGKDEFGGSTATETNIDMQLMCDLSPIIHAGKNTFKAGLEYQYWKNKFGNDYRGAAGPGAFAKTPMIRAEYHF